MTKNRTSLYMLLVGILATGAAFAEQGQNHFMQRFDLNNDGNITLDEFNQGSAERFGRMDRDNNNMISQDEFKAYASTRRSERMLKKMDSNNDGQITRQEFLDAKMKSAEQQFTGMDTDANGVISASELNASRMGRHERFGKIYDRIDANRDGNVTRDESQTAWTRWFSKMDQNGDGLVTANEVMEMRKNRMQDSQEEN